MISNENIMTEIQNLSMAGQKSSLLPNFIKNKTTIKTMRRQTLTKILPIQTMIMQP